MSIDYLFWAYKRVPHACELEGIDGVAKTYRLGEGVPLLEGFPSDARYRMDPDLPDQTLVPDHVTNLTANILVSQRTEVFLRGKNLPNVEYLPARIIDHRGRPVSTPYFIVNPVGPLDILDLDASQAVRDDEDENDIARLGKFVVKPEACVDLPPLFRILGLTRYLAIHRELASELLAQGFTGNAFVEPEKLVGARIPPDLRYLVPD